MSEHMYSKCQMHRLSSVKVILLIVLMNIITTYSDWIQDTNARVEEINRDSFDGRYWNVSGMKGMMKGQTIRLQKLPIETNIHSTCYEAECIGNSCPTAVIDRFYSFCYPAVIITGVPKCGTSAMYELLSHLPNAVTMAEKENCPYTKRRPHWKYFLSLPSLTRVNASAIVVDGCIDHIRNIVIRAILREPKTVYIVLTRDYPSMLWSSYNFWCSLTYDGDTCDSSRYTKIGIHERTPEIFHGMVSGDADGKTIPNPLFNDHPCINAKSYYIEYLNNLWKKISYNATLVIASEDLQHNPRIVWNKIGTRLGLSMTERMQHALYNVSKLRYNTQEGGKDYRHSISIDNYKHGQFAVSNFTTMLNSTLQLLNKCWIDDCIVVSQLTGYRYQACSSLQSDKWINHQNTSTFLSNPIDEILLLGIKRDM